MSEEVKTAVAINSSTFSTGMDYGWTILCYIDLLLILNAHHHNHHNHHNHHYHHQYRHLNKYCNHYYNS
jgi:hypothetical protein